MKRESHTTPGRYLRVYRRQAQRFVLLKVLHADDPPHALALGAAVGMFVTFTPTIGFQMALVVLLAWLLGGNKVVGVPLVWLSNPLTFVPIYYPCYRIGIWLLGGEGVGLAWWRRLAAPPDGWWDMLQYYWHELMTVALPLWIGCLPVAALAGATTYVLVYQLICSYRLRRWGRLTPPAPPTHHLRRFRQGKGGAGARVG